MMTDKPVMLEHIKKHLKTTSNAEKPNSLQEIENGFVK